jgi:hypothetical protein
MAIVNFSSPAIRLSGARPTKETRLVASGVQRYLTIYDCIQDLPGVPFASFERKMDIVNLALDEIDDPAKMGEAVAQLQRLESSSRKSPDALRAEALRNIASAHAIAFALQDQIQAERLRNGLQPLQEDVRSRIRSRIGMDFFSSADSRKATTDWIRRLFCGARAWSRMEVDDDAPDELAAVLAA